MVAAMFWLSVAVVAYAYVGYLAALVLLDAWRALKSNARFLASEHDRRVHHSARDVPSVSVLIAAHNEGGCIREKIEDTLALEYPKEKLQILIGSDGSTDGTDAIVQEYADRGVQLSVAPRAGKVSVLNRLAGLATGDIWLFTDANTRLHPDALRLLVRRLDEPGVGGVCGRLRLVTPQGAPAGEGLYWKYENLLKFYESRSGALMGANGGLYALRRQEWRPLPPDTIVDDFVVTMRVLLHGRRLVYEPAAVAEEETATDLAEEERRRVRISTGNFQSLRLLAPLLHRADFVGFAFWSHKVLRWIAPVLLLIAFATNALLLTSGGLYVLTMAAQLALVAAAFFPSSSRLAALCRYFVSMNVALARGMIRYLTTKPSAVWERTERQPTRRAA